MVLKYRRAVTTCGQYHIEGDYCKLTTSATAPIGHLSVVPDQKV